MKLRWLCPFTNSIFKNSKFQNVLGFAYGMSLFFFSQPALAEFAKLNPRAPKGGTFRFHLNGEPAGLHPILHGDYSSWTVQTYIHDYLCETDLNTYQFIGKIAESWTISKDGLEIIFKIRKGIYFHNEQLLTPDDVVFSFNAFKDPAYKQGFWQSFLSGITEITALSDHEVKMKFKEKYYQNIDSICAVPILPKSVYSNLEQSQKMIRQSIGAGPYRLEKFEQGQSLVVKKFNRYYGDSVDSLKGFNNFETIVFVPTQDSTVALEKLKKGELDFMEISSLEDYLQLTNGVYKDRVEFPKFTLKSIQNSMPWSINYIGFNTEDEILKDVRVREALSHLANREELNAKLYNSLKGLSNGPIPASLPQAADTPPVKYDPRRAQTLLKEAGWRDENKDGILEKEIHGKLQNLKLTVMYSNKEYEKILTTLQESYKKAGIQLELLLLERKSFRKKLSEKDVQLFTEGWAGQDPNLDPKLRWHSTSISENGLNHIRYKNPKVDHWIDEARTNLNLAQRNRIFKKAYTQIAKDFPALFLFYNKFYFYAVSNEIQMSGDTFKFDYGTKAWWHK